jgi:NADH-quinone oxidoreductase subunit E
VRTEEGYQKFFGSKEFDALFDELILDKLVMSRIMDFVRRKPVAAIEIPKSLDLEPSEVARHLQHLTDRGLVKFESGQTLVAAV